MQIFVDFESSILINSLSLEKLFLSIRNNGFGFQSQINQTVLQSLPYNIDVIAILKENYTKHTDEIFVMFEEENKNYAEMFVHQFREEIPNLILLKKKNKDKIYTIESHTHSYAYVGTSIMDGLLYKNSKESSISSNFISYFIHKIIATKAVDSRNKGLEGFLSTFFKHFYIIMPLFAIWPSWMEVDQTIINLYRVKATYISTLGFMGFSSLFRCFVSLDRERSLFFKEIETITDPNFVYGAYSINMGIFVMFFFFFFGLFAFYVNFVGALAGILITSVNFTVLYSRFWRRWITVIASSVIINLMFHPIFMKKFLKII